MESHTFNLLEEKTAISVSFGNGILRNVYSQDLYDFIEFMTLKVGV